MSEREGYQHGVPCWVDAIQPDPTASARFYGGLFGWGFEGPGPGNYFVARVRGRDVAGIGQPYNGAAIEPAWNTYILVDSADGAAQGAKSAGGAVVVEPVDVLPAGRLAVLADPGGARFGVWEPSSRKGAQLVNEAGAWAMSILTTANPTSVKDFYAAMFGWEAEALGPIENGIALFRLPGYIGGEPRQPVPRDVVAVMMSSSGSDSARENSSHWSVNFWVDDADAVAAKAETLGGKILVAPFDSHVSRDAVLVDPSGGVFSVSTQPSVARAAQAARAAR
jgi:predicted enzyme related to lactoylglutathione lyase